MRSMKCQKSTHGSLHRHTTFIIYSYLSGGHTRPVRVGEVHWTTEPAKYSRQMSWLLKYSLNLKAEPTHVSIIGNRIGGKQENNIFIIIL